MEDKIRAIRLAAERGDRDAQFQLAVAYRRGEGIRRNRVTAMKWYLLASFQGDGDADFQAAMLGDELTDMQERRAVASALRWKYRHEMETILAQLLNPGTIIPSNDQEDDNLRVFVKLPDRLN